MHPAPSHSPSRIVRLHRAAVALPLVLVTASLLSCGGAQTSATTTDSPYAARCRKDRAEHGKNVKELTYLQPDFKGALWPAGGLDSDGMLHEAALFEALRQGKVHWVYIQARGGIGKTELSKAIASETCASVPAFRVDLRQLFGPDALPAKAAAGAEGQAIEVALTEQLAAGGGGNLAELIGKGRWILALDAIEEVVTPRRAEALKAIADLRARHPDAQVVLLGRPSIFEDAYGIKDFDARLELPPLDCGRARSSLARLSDDAADRRRINGFVATWHLDRQSLVGQQCYFPYLATYRDIQVVQRLAKTFNPDTEMGGLQATLLEVHEAILAERLLKELADLKMTAAEALQAVDVMVAKGGYQDGEWNLTFTVQRCLESQTAGDAPRQRQVCEKLFQSVLFDRLQGADKAGAGQWQFGFQDIADLFVARWLEAQLALTPNACTAVEQHAEMIAGKTIAGYLVGRPNGARCLQSVTRAMCKSGGFSKDKVGMLYKGLPLGPSRAGFVQQAKDFESKHGADACATQILGAL